MSDDIRNDEIIRHWQNLSRLSPIVVAMLESGPAMPPVIRQVIGTWLQDILWDHAGVDEDWALGGAPDDPRVQIAVFEEGATAAAVHFVIDALEEFGKEHDLIE